MKLIDVKQLLHLTLLFFLSTATLLGQCPTGNVVLTSQAEIDAFATDYPGCTVLPFNLEITGSDITDLSGLSEITELSSGFINLENNPLLTSTTGFGPITFAGGQGFLIKDNPLLDDITSLTGSFANGTGFIGVVNCPLIPSLAPFSSFSGSVDIDINNCDAIVDLSGLEGITETPTLFLTDNDLLQDITALSNAGGATSNLNIWGSPLLASLDGLQGYTDVDLDLVISGLPLLTNLDPLSGLDLANGFPSGTIIDITFNDALVDISGLQNMNADNIGIIIMEENPMLSDCSIISFCNFLAAGGDITLSNNATGCNSNIEISDGCGLEFNEINGTILFDFNANDCDSGDYEASSIIIEFTNGTDVLSTATDFEGTYDLFVPWEGTVTARVLPESLPDSFEATPESTDIVFTGFGNAETADFCLTASSVLDDLRITMLPVDDARPGFDVSYLLVYENVGTTALSGSVILEFDDSRQQFLEAIPTEIIIVGNTIQWDYVDLFPFESRTIGLSFNNFPPPTNEDGDLLTFQATVTPVTSDDNPDDNVYVFTQTMVNSQDPNDKLVAQGTQILEEQVGDYLDYMVRFQNIGTASAINVRVEDTLSDNLDWSSFRVLSSSHDYELQINNGNELIFTYDGIDLPPEASDPEGSQGYIAFQVRTLPTLQLGDFVANEANIFFDFNAPILTNTVTTTVVEPLGLEDSLLKNRVLLYPNPAVEELYVRIPEGISMEEMVLYTVTGERVRSTSNTALDVSNLATGIYFVSISTDQGVLSKKFVKH